MTKFKLLRSYYRSSLKGPANFLRSYWQFYGGGAAFARSPYTHASMLLLLLTSWYWTHAEWWRQPISIIPGLLGFSLAGFAIFVGFSDRGFQQVVATSKDGQGRSAFLSVCASYVHFIIAQLFSLLMAVTAEALNFKLAWPTTIRPWVDMTFAAYSAIGYFLFIYSLVSILAAAGSLYRTATWFQRYQDAVRD